MGAVNPCASLGACMYKPPCAPLHREEDVTVTMYPGPEKVVVPRPSSKVDPGPSSKVDPGSSSKVDTVCNAVRQAMLELGEDRHVAFRWSQASLALNVLL